MPHLLYVYIFKVHNYIQIVLHVFILQRGRIKKQLHSHLEKKNFYLLRLQLFQ